MKINGRAMFVLFFFAMLASLGLLLLGLLSPKSLTPLVKGIWSRGRIAAVFGGAAAFSFFASAIAAPPVEQAPEIADEVTEDVITDDTDAEVLAEDIDGEAEYVAETEEVEEPSVETETKTESTKANIVTTPTPEPEDEREAELDAEPVVVAPTPAPAQTASCQCSSNTLNCGDFATHASAQVYYECCMDQVGRDVHGLDGNDNDGLACEGNP